MNLSLRIHYLSSKKVTAAFVLFWVVAFAAFTLTRNLGWGSIAIVCILLGGTSLWSREWYIVMRPVGPVFERVNKALDLLGLHYRTEVDHVLIEKPRVTVKVKSLGEFALLYFVFDYHQKKTERVLRNALLKVLRQS